VLILEGAGGLPRPGGEVGPPPGQELLGAVTSHGPSRESHKRSRETIGQAAPGSPPAQGPTLSAQGMRAAFSSAASAAALLQSAVPGGGAGVVAVEGAATLPRDGGGPTEAERAEPALPGAGPQPETF
jgi:hypothetical protein